MLAKRKATEKTKSKSYFFKNPNEIDSSVAIMAKKKKEEYTNYPKQELNITTN